MSIPLDINKPFVPKSVTLSKLATDIIEICRESEIDIPHELSHFVKKYHNDSAGFQWETELCSHLSDMSDELLEKWISVIKGHFCRAILRAELRTRKEAQNGKSANHS